MITTSMPNSKSPTNEGHSYSEDAFDKVRTTRLGRMMNDKGRLSFRALSPGRSLD
jgi:hypothetical protein